MAKILLVEDEAHTRLLYTLELEQDGHVVHAVEKAAEGLRLAAIKAIDLIVLDIRIPGSNALVAMRRFLKQQPETPVVLHTAYDCYRDDFQSWLAAAYVIKSSDTKELRKTIRRILSGQAGLQ